MIKSRLIDFKKIEEMCENEKEIEKTDKIVYIAEKILDFNKKNQEGQGLKILTPDQMLTNYFSTIKSRK